MHGLQAGRKRATLPGTEEAMTTTIECLTAFSGQVADQLAGLLNHRGMGGGTLGLWWPQWGVGVGWAWATAHGAAHTLQWLMRQGEERMLVLSDTGFHAAAGAPVNLTVCPRGAWEERMLVETGLSMLTLVCHVTQGRPRGWASCQARLAFTMAACNGLVQGHGLEPDASGFVPLSIAACSL